MSAAAAPLVGHGFSSFAALIDVQPDIGSEDDGRTRLSLSQCAGCSLVDFLRGGRPGTLDRHPVFKSIVGFFDRLPAIERARAAGNTRALRSACEDFGARHLFTVDDGTLSRASLDLPRIHVMDAAPSADLATARWALVRPDRDGPDRIHLAIAQAVRRGVRRILIGYHRHSAAMDRWSDFADGPGFGERWRGVVRAAWELGVTELVLLMPYPACALLQWREHHPLEALRARLDLQLRRVGAETSLMCPENVSGYALYNDTQAVREGTLIARQAFGIRFEDLVMLL